MALFRRDPVIVAVHSGSFHVDDVFAVAIISLYLRKEGKDIEVIRSREEGVLMSSDYVFDVGGEYNPETHRYDHHQVGGAGNRENNIPYAAAGLAWKHFGRTLCQNNEDIWSAIDEYLIQPIDAVDNGKVPWDEYMKKAKQDNLPVPYSINSIFSLFQPIDDANATDDERDAGFIRAVVFAEEIIAHEIAKAHVIKEKREKILGIYNNHDDKQVIVFKEASFSRRDINAVLVEHSGPETLYAVFPRRIVVVEGPGGSIGKSIKEWKVLAIRAAAGSFASRKPFPESWRGLRDDALAQVTGVPTAQFCHNAGFLAVLGASLDDAITLARKAIEA